MKNTAVVYKSKYGSTAKYAAWIAEDAGADLFEAGRIRADRLQEYQTIVYCGGLYAGGILGFSFIKKNYPKLRDKQLIVVAVGATTQSEKAKQEVKAKNFTDAMQENALLFVLRGGLNYPKMNWLDRCLMYMLKKAIQSKRPEERDDDSLGILATYGKMVDFTDRSSIGPVLEAIRKSNNQSPNA